MSSFVRQVAAPIDFSSLVVKYPYLMRTMKSLRAIQHLPGGLGSLFEILHTDHSVTTLRFEDFNDLHEVLRQANLSMLPKEAWEFHH